MASLFRIVSLLGAMMVSLAHIGHHDLSSSAHLSIRRARAKVQVLPGLQRGSQPV